MSTTITCPHCKSQFALEDVMTDEIKKELRAEMITYKQQKEAEFSKKIASLQAQQAAAEKSWQMQMEAQRQQLTLDLQKKIAGDYEARLKMLEEERSEKAKQLQEMQKKELELLRDKDELQQQWKNFELELERRVLERQKLIEEQVSRREHEMNELKFKEKEHQIEQLKKLIEEMKRKSEQGSMQLQGEVQELALEEMLATAFPYDDILAVGKGVRGADVVQLVKNQVGQECGKIIYESKRTQAFAGDWIEKLKADMRAQGADIAVIVTQSMPKDMHHFGQKEGVWICNFQEIRSLALVLRDGLIKISQAVKSQENKGDKMQMLYDFLTGNEFRQQIEAIVEGFMSMKQAITRERVQMEKIWKEREKQLEKVLLNTTHLYASVKGIAGAAIGEVKLLEDSDDHLLQA